MRKTILFTSLSFLLSSSGWAAPQPVALPAQLTVENVNDASMQGAVSPKAQGPSVLRAQVLLDRAHFSPGEIDAAYGSNVQKALLAFQKANGITPTGVADAATWTALNRNTQSILVTYKLTEKDQPWKRSVKNFTPAPNCCKN